MRKRNAKFDPKDANLYNDDKKQALIQQVLTPDYFMNLQKKSPNAYNFPYHPMNLPQQDHEPNELPMSIDETSKPDSNEYHELKHQSGHYENNGKHNKDDKNEESNV
jgi:hypothetical protein